jgi:hypothetical protein
MIYKSLFVYMTINGLGCQSLTDQMSIYVPGYYLTFAAFHALMNKLQMDDRGVEVECLARRAG